MPDYSFAKRNLAGLLVAWAQQEGEKNQNPEKARELLLRSLALDDKNAGAWHLTGISYGVQGNHTKAAEMFEKAWAMEPTNKGFARDLVMALRGAGNMVRADEVTKQAGL
jgi:tetratricopeptide (TPR) repeat protein